MERGYIPILLIHPQSAAHGLNLQFGGHHLVWFTMLWSLERYLQTNARLARSGKATLSVSTLYLHGILPMN
jgi:SNF2 family DNA or RNA helicase